VVEEVSHPEGEVDMVYHDRNRNSKGQTASLLREECQALTLEATLRHCRHILNNNSSRSSALISISNSDRIRKALFSRSSKEGRHRGTFPRVATMPR